MFTHLTPRQLAAAQVCLEHIHANPKPDIGATLDDRLLRAYCATIITPRAGDDSIPDFSDITDPIPQSMRLQLLDLDFGISDTRQG